MARKIRAGHSQSISYRGTVLGYADNPGYYFVWNRAWGARRVTDLLAPGSPGYDVLQLVALSGGGIIAGSGYRGDFSTALLLVPNSD